MDAKTKIEVTGETCKYSLLSDPERSEWRMTMFRGGFVFFPVKGNHPNWFNRKMQELCFGIKWEKK